MANTAFFIDLSNFYGHLLKSKIAEPKVLKEYFLTWLDFDLLAKSISDNYSGIWIFYSGQRVGPSSERIYGKFLNKFINRINILPGVTARDVNVPGEQREQTRYKCKICGQENVLKDRTEKGVDSSLTVHLFDTMDSWDTAFLLSGDADFVPVVASLRRRGKIIIGVGFLDASEALIRECYNYINIEEIFLRDDLLVFKLLINGIINKWFTDDVKQDPKFNATPSVTLGMALHEDTPDFKYSSYHINFWVNGLIDLSKRYQLFNELKNQYGDQIQIFHESGIKCTISQISWFGHTAMMRKSRKSLLSMPGINFSGTDKEKLIGEFMINYAINEKTGKYEIVGKSDGSPN